MISDSFASISVILPFPSSPQFAPTTAFTISHPPADHACQYPPAAPCSGRLNSRRDHRLMNYTIISRLCKILFLISSHFVNFSYCLWVLYLKVKSITIKIKLRLSSFLYRRTVILKKGDIGFEEIPEMVLSFRCRRR